MIFVDILACSSCGLLSLLTIIILKVALRRKQINRTFLTSRVQFQDNYWQNTRFLLMRFTIIEMFAVRTAHLKLNWLLSVAVCALLALLPGNSYYWGWIVATSLGMVVFLLLELRIFKVERELAIDLEDFRTIKWRRPMLYGIYAMLSVVGFCYIAWSFAYAGIRTRVFGRKLGIMLLADQILGRTILSLTLGIITKTWTPMKTLKAQYLEFQWPEETIQTTLKQPSNHTITFDFNRKTFPSPQKVPKAPTNETQVQNTANQQRLDSRQSMLDSVVNFLEYSQKKRIAKARLPPIHSIYGTPTNQLRKHGTQDYQMEGADTFQHNKYQTPIRLIKTRQSNNMLMNDIEKALDDKVDGIEQEIPVIPNNDKQIKSNFKDIKTFKDQNNDHYSLDKDAASSNQLELQCYTAYHQQRIRNGGNQKIESHIQKTQTLSNQNQKDELNTLELCCKNEIKDKIVQTPSQIIPKFLQDDNIQDQQHHRQIRHISNKRKQIEQIKQELEEVQHKNIRFKIVQKQREFQEDSDALDKSSKTLDPVRALRPNRYENHAKTRSSFLEIREDGIGELQEVDLNSPIKRKQISPTKMKQIVNIPIIKQKRTRQKKRDIRQLIKFDSGSPYLEYLPHMLSKQIEQNKRRASERLIGRGEVFRENPDDSKRGRITKRATNPQVRQDSQLLRHEIQFNKPNNQNKHPEDQFQDF